MQQLSNHNLAVKNTSFHQSFNAWANNAKKFNKPQLIDIIRNKAVEAFNKNIDELPLVEIKAQIIAKSGENVGIDKALQHAFHNYKASFQVANKSLEQLSHIWKENLTHASRAKENQALLLALISSPKISDQELYKFFNDNGIRTNGGWFNYKGKPTSLQEAFKTYRNKTPEEFDAFVKNHLQEKSFGMATKASTHTLQKSNAFEEKTTQAILKMGLNPKDAALRAAMKESLQAAAQPNKAARNIDTAHLEKEITQAILTMGLDPKDLALRAAMKESLKATAQPNAATQYVDSRHKKDAARLEQQITHTMLSMGLDSKDLALRTIMKESLQAAAHTDKAALNGDNRHKIAASDVENQTTEAMLSMGLDPNDATLRLVMKKSLQAAIDNEKVNQRVAEMQKMFTTYLDKDFVLKDVPGDGDCFFYSVACQLYAKEADPKDMLELRKLVATHMETNSDMYRWQIDSDFDTHLLNLKESAKGKEKGIGQGEFIHAKALSEVTGRPVHIYFAKDPSLGQLHDDKGLPIPGDGFRFSGQGEPIRLIYNGINHWMHLNKLN